jgi:hypothetical protein
MELPDNLTHFNVVFVPFAKLSVFSANSHPVENQPTNGIAGEVLK